MLLITGLVTYINSTGATSEAGTTTLPEHLSSSPIFNGVRVTQTLILCVCFVEYCLSFCPFSFGHCVVYSSSITDYDYSFGIFNLFIANFSLFI